MIWLSEGDCAGVWLTLVVTNHIYFAFAPLPEVLHGKKPAYISES